jgi:hypothetical protein
VKIRPKANKNEIIYLLGENYGERRRAYSEKKIGKWESKIRANEEQMRWDQETQEEERPTEPAEPKLIKGAISGRIQRWFVDGSEYKDAEVFLYDIESGVKKIIEDVKRVKESEHEFGMCVRENGYENRC